MTNRGASSSWSSSQASASSSSYSRQPPHFRCVAALSAYVTLVLVLVDVAFVHHPPTLSSTIDMILRVRNSNNNDTQMNDHDNNSTSPYPYRRTNPSSILDDFTFRPFTNESATTTAMKSRIRYVLRHGPNAYRPMYSAFSCYPYPNILNPLPDNLRRPGVLDFFPTISTSLTIAVVGDSVGIQIAQVMEEALGSDRHYRTAHVETRMANLVVSSPVRGGGSFLSYRVNGMLWPDLQVVRRTRRRRRRRRLLRRLQPPRPTAADHNYTLGTTRPAQPLAPQQWNRSHVQWAMKHHSPNPIRGVDVLVQRITFPWTPLELITMESLERNAHVAADLFGMRTLVYVTFYFCNNVLDPPMHKLFREKLHVVRNFTETYVPSHNSTLKRVLLLNMDRLVDLLNEENARSLGYDTVNEPFEKWMMSHYRGRSVNNSSTNATTTNNGTTPLLLPPPEPYHRHYHAQVCGEMVPDYAPSCVRNSIFIDGMHFCPSALGGRITAGIACLIECAEINDSMPEQLVSNSDASLRLCERKCNDKFMSLDPVLS